MDDLEGLADVFGLLGDAAKGAADVVQAANSWGSADGGLPPGAVVPASEYNSTELADWDLMVGRAHATLLVRRRTFFVNNTYSVALDYEFLGKDVRGVTINSSGTDFQAALYPLHWAAEVGWAGLVQGLIEKDVPINGLDKEEATPLTLAVKHGWADVTSVLLTFGAGVDVKAQGLAPIMHACGAPGSTWPVVSLLLKHGANPNEQNGLGVTPLYLAAACGNLAVVEGLLADGAAVVDAAANKQAVHKTSPTRRDGVTPLHRAACTGNYQVAELLLKKGANVNAQTKPQLETPMHLAISKGHVKIATLLLEFGPDLTITDHLQRTPYKSIQAFAPGSKELTALLKPDVPAKTGGDKKWPWGGRKKAG